MTTIFSWSAASRFPKWTLPILIAATLLASGCSESLSPEMLAVRKRFLSDKLASGSSQLREEPIMTIREQLKDGRRKDGETVLVRARINAGDLPPFAEGLASMTLTDATGHDGDESHDPHECPFCKRDILEMMAILEFCDGEGKVIPEDARSLFDLREFDLVLVEGTVRTKEDGMLHIQATRLQVIR
ncbi:MAG: OB-fold nucleic acid binding domain-containing protein [Planctomycetaceae bacterium]|nr:OB-fold nucleic acid binding domain-containing protein [Planctomycetaceae bacterium]